jgi:hypothetical protein
VDFCVTKGIPQDFAVAKSWFDLCSDHFPILIAPTADAMNHENEQILSNRHTKWDDFRCLISERLTLNIPLKTEEGIEAAAKLFHDTIQWVGWNATLEHKGTHEALNFPIKIKQNIEEKEDSVENGATYGHLQARDYLTQQHRNSKNSSMTTKMTASNHSCKGLHLLNPLIIPSGKRPKN